jgi:HEAT repeat protein
MTTRVSLAMFVLIGLAAGGCRRAQQPNVAPTSAPPPIPPLALRELIPELRNQTATPPVVPDPAVLKRNAELIEIAFLPEAADARTRAMAQRSLRDEREIGYALEAGLAHASPAVRSQCAWHLGELTFTPSIPTLLVRLRQDENDGNVTPWLVGALVRLGCLGALDKLLAALVYEPTSATAGRVGLEVLTHCGQTLAPDSSYAAIQAAISALHEDWLGTGTPPPNAPGIFVGELDPSLRHRLRAWMIGLAGQDLRPVDNARFIFARIGRMGLPMVRELLHAKEDYVRRYGVEICDALGVVAAELGDDLHALLADPFTAALAARALGAVGHRPALPHLLARLHDPSPESKVGAIDGLGLLGDAAALAPLQQSLTNEGEPMDVRVHAAWALAMLSPGDRFLRERRARGDYHRPTVDALLDSLDRARFRAERGK